MKINTNAFISFVTKASLNGDIQTMNIEFTDDGLTSAVHDQSNTTLTMTTLKLSAIEDYEKRDEVFIRNTGAFLKALRKLDDTFDFSIVENYVMKIVSGNRTGFIMLGSEMACDNKRKDGEPTIDFTSTFSINKSDIIQSVQDTKDLDIKQTVIEKTDTNVTFTVGEKGESDYFITTLESPETGTGKVKVGEMFLKLYAVLNGEISISLGTNKPIKVIEDSDNVKFTCIIAPIIDN